MCHLPGGFLAGFLNHQQYHRPFNPTPYTEAVLSGRWWGAICLEGLGKTQCTSIDIT